MQTARTRSKLNSTEQLRNARQSRAKRVDYFLWNSALNNSLNSASWSVQRPFLSLALIFPLAPLSHGMSSLVHLFHLLTCMKSVWKGKSVS